MRKLELEENNDFDFDGLWQNKLDLLEKENAELRERSDFDDQEDAEFLKFYKEGYTRVRAHWRSLPNRAGMSLNDYFLKTLENYNDAILGSDSSTDISKIDQEEANREAKEIVKSKLENSHYNLL